jgi:hypothetical protein
VTYALLNDICQTPSGSDRPTDKPSLTLNQYQDLRAYVIDTGRISLASRPKSFLQAHYNKKKIFKARSETDVIVDSGLVYELYDTAGNRWPAKHPFSASSVTVAHLCTIQLPSPTTYDTLQSSVVSTTQTSNDAIAHQHACRDDLNIHEFISFATLRSGPNLQWLNIAKELRTRVLTFHKEEVHLLLMQSVWQIGCITRSGELKQHEDLRSLSFCHVLLDELENLLRDVQSNWMEVTTVRSVVAICTRVLTATKISDGVQEKAYGLIRFARRVAYEWMKSLVSNPPDSTNEDLLSEHQKTITEMALTCRCTYDVDKKHLKNLLLRGCFHFP